MVENIIDSIEIYISYLLARKTKGIATYGRVLKLKRIIIDLKEIKGDYKTKTINK